MSEALVTLPQSSTNVPLKLNEEKRAKEIGAIVLGGNYRGLGIVRSLGRHGIPVWVLTDEHELAGSSRYAKRTMAWPAEETRRLDFLHRLCEQYSLQRWVLFPTGDDDAALVARHHASLAKDYTLTVPAWDTLRWTYDKRLTYQLAKETGVAFPVTCYPNHRAFVAALECQFPVILKPAVKESFNPFVHAKAWQVDNRAQLIARYDQASTMVPSDTIMIQEMIPGDGAAQLSYAALCTEGSPRVSVVARRTRQYPVDFGRSSTFVESIDEPEVEQASLPLLAALHYTGLVEVEFKRDPRTGQLKLLDINPRVWGWHTLSRRFGGDFPYLFWRLLNDLEIPQVRVPAGVHWMRSLTDMLAIISGIRHGKMRLLDYFRSLKRPLELAIFAVDDPLPAIVEALLLAQVVLRRKAL